MAAGLTDHIWSVAELLGYKLAPAPWVEPRRRGRPRKATGAAPTEPKRPRGWPRKLAWVPSPISGAVLHFLEETHPHL